MNNQKTAIVLGATGLVGKNLVQILIHDELFSTIKVFVRRSLGFTHPKIKENIVDFNDFNSFKEHIKGDVLFSSLGTTIKQAGTKDAQKEVDFTYQYEFAKAASDNGVLNYCLVSSTGANANSRVFYSRIKGELENSVSELSFEKICILRPSVLVGVREEKRMGEIFGSSIISVLSKIIPPLKKYRGIKGEEVAMALINSYKKSFDSRIQIFELEEVFNLNK